MNANPPIILFFQENLHLIIRCLLALVIIGAGFLLKAVYTKHISPAILKRIPEGKHAALHILLNGFSKPIGCFLLVSGLYFGLILLPLQTWLPSLAAFLYRVYRMLFLLFTGWGLSASSDLVLLLFSGTLSKMDINNNQTISHFCSKLFRIFIAVIFGMIAIREMGFDVAGLLTGLGLGGLTFALAAQDSASNFFGGLVILLDHPFALGDWICCGSIEGQVEDISFRSCQIRTAQNTVVIVPNSKLSGEAITNWTRLNMRQLKFTLTMRQDSPVETIELFLARLRTMLKAREDLHPETVQVHFNEFGDSSYDIMVLCFTKAVDLHPSLHTREEINIQILKLMEELGLGFAYPTRTILSEKVS